MRETKNSRQNQGDRTGRGGSHGVNTEATDQLFLSLRETEATGGFYTGK